MFRDCLSKFAGLSLECVAAEAQAAVSKAFGHLVHADTPSIEDQMRLMPRFASPMHCKQFSGRVVGFDMFGDLDVILARQFEDTSCYLHFPAHIMSICADLITPGRSIRWIARISCPLLFGTSSPLFVPGDLLAIVLTPHEKAGDALVAELLRAGDLGSACVATVIQVMQPQDSRKYGARLIRVLLYIHDCCGCDGTMRSDRSGILLLWDHQLGIAALFQEGETLMLQAPVWVSSYDADDVSDWGCGTDNPILLEVGPLSVLLVTPIVLKAVAVTAEAVVCPSIMALELTFVHALPCSMLLSDARAGMRGICCMVRIVSFTFVREASLDSAHVRVISGNGRGFDAGFIQSVDCSSLAMYKVCDEWGACSLLLPLETHNPNLLLHKTVILNGFDCRALVQCGSNILMPHTGWSCRQLPVN